jgi:hypothetical protein
MITGFEIYKLIGTLPFLSLSIYMAIFERVMKTFLKSIAVFIIIPMTFALSFNNLYYMSDEGGSKQNEDDGFNTFQSPFISFVKVFAMMTGEFGKMKFNFQEHIFSILHL